MARHGAVVERTRERGDEVDVTGGSAFQKAPARHFDYHFDLRRLGGLLARRGSAIVRIVHRASISQATLSACFKVATYICLIARLFAQHGRACLRRVSDRESTTVTRMRAP